MKDNVDYLPIWKAGSTVEEQFMELALIARKHPERFERFIVIYQESKDNHTRTDYLTKQGLQLNCTLGLLEMGKFELLKECYRLMQD